MQQPRSTRSCSCGGPLNPILGYINPVGSITTAPGPGLPCPSFTAPHCSHFGVKAAVQYQMGSTPQPCSVVPQITSLAQIHPPSGRAGSQHDEEPRKASVPRTLVCVCSHVGMGMDWFIKCNQSFRERWGLCARTQSTSPPQISLSAVQR